MEGFFDKFHCLKFCKLRSDDVADSFERILQNCGTCKKKSNVNGLSVSRVI